jgi:hypothetical protein
VAPVPPGARPSRRGFGLTPSYTIVYGDDENLVRQTLHGVVLEREDGWLIVFRGKDVILRLQESHVRSVEPSREI